MIATTITSLHLVVQNRGLADRVSEDPPTIQLRFMHKTGDQDRGVDEYYLHSKENKCVSCGETGHYLRYRVVPACYRRNFPVQWKSHRSHDIVLLCVDCHHVAHRAAEMVKKELSREYGVPLFPPRVKPEEVGGNVVNVHPYNVRRAAVALKVHGQKLPEQRRKQLQQTVRLFLKGEQTDGEGWLSQEELEQGLLAGVGPRQRRRTLRQLAAEKDEAGTADQSGTADQTAQSQTVDLEATDDIAQDDSEEAATAIDTAKSHLDDTGIADRSTQSSFDEVSTADSTAQVQSDEVAHKSAERTDDAEQSREAQPSSEQNRTSHSSEQNESSHRPAPTARRANRASAELAASVSSSKHSAETDTAVSDKSVSSHESDEGEADVSDLHYTDEHDAGINDKPTSSQQKNARSDTQTIPDEETNGHAWHGRQVVNAAVAKGGSDALLILISRFRQCFTDALNPQYLPASWHVMHR